MSQMLVGIAALQVEVDMPVLQVRLSEKDMERFANAAEAQNLKPATYARTVLLRALADTPDEAEVARVLDALEKSEKLRFRLRRLILLDLPSGEGPPVSK